MEPLNFLWIPGIHGDSQDPRHIGDFNVLRSTLSVYVTSKSHGRVHGHAVMAQPEDFDFVVRCDTPEFQTLFVATAKQQFIHTAILTSEKNQRGRSAGVLVRFVMRDIYSMRLMPTTFKPPVPQCQSIVLSCKSLDISRL